eukprot:NODE_215_length_2701_cov_43.093137_g197_i0.p1 GENE.NODE_215_length_2701_cov_43.093137_g197_i0~~NODE_215_length_2701_cov_43.093137_g197_i0.p1  ORF type:complete len:558 (+),score=105.51 NODE_215_length_2701_cov_43.093137_g197_i0:115-1788(+)
MAEIVETMTSSPKMVTAGGVAATAVVTGAVMLWKHLDSETLSKDQQAQLKFIEDCYKDTIPDKLDLPPEFATEDGKPEIEMTRRFEYAYWESIIERNGKTTGFAAASTEAQDIITMICQYQRKRSYGKVVGGKRGDPINLMWEEFKNFLVVLATVQSVTEETIKSVQQRIHYIERLGDEKFFTVTLLGADSGGNNTLLTMERVRNDLSTRVLPVLEREFNTLCVRNKLEELIKRCRKLIAELIKYCLYVYSDTKLDEGFRFADLDNGTLSGTLVGSLLSALRNSNSVKWGHDEVERSLEEDNLFSNAAGKMQIDPQLVPPKMQGKSVDEIVKENGKKSGIHKELREEASLRPYFTLLGLIQEFAAFTGHWRTTRDLAGVGGDLMIYGPGLEHINRLCPAFCELTRRINECVEATNLTADALYLTVLKENNSKAFRKNAQVCRKMRFVFVEHLQKVQEECDAILSTANRSVDIADKTQKKWDAFLQSSATVLGRLQRCGIDAPPPSAPSRQLGYRAAALELMKSATAVAASSGDKQNGGAGGASDSPTNGQSKSCVIS